MTKANYKFFEINVKHSLELYCNQSSSPLLDIGLSQFVIQNIVELLSFVS